ncbi:MAG TPA: vitamin K epoxide reductase family protein [Gaiellaceae bacterium]|nr:vitamin K epoxide reductase family protein [Gaiellaceae bacterium]
MRDRSLRASVLILSSLGAGIAAYLTVTHLAHVQVACATGGCETVQTSRYAEVAGIPVAAIGLAGYLVLAGTAIARGSVARAAGFVAALAGVAVAMVLLYVQVAVLHAYCQWCLASDAILVALVPLTLLRASRGAPPRAGP